MAMQVAPVRNNTVITRSRLDALLAPDFFLWSTGIEDTFITDPHRATGRTLDEYALTQHYERWREDIDLIASLGVSYARYGLPWYRIEAEPGRWDFSWPDQVFESILAKGVQPIVDLMHYGTPAWLGGGFGNPDYPERVAEYARRIGERYKGRVFWYTPLNEPRITAYYCGRLGWWPPYGRGWRGFLQVMIAVCKGIVLTQQSLHAIDPEIVAAHVDATDVYRPESSDAEADATLRQQVVFLALDLVTGRVDSRHPLLFWLRKHGVDDNDLTWFQERAIELDVVGLNLYPMFTNKIVQRSGTRSRVKMRYGSATLIDELGRMYWERYRRPLFISETAAVGSRRGKWMQDSLEAVTRLRQEGIPMVGYTWWPLFALVAWAYRQKELPFDKYLLQLGLWDLSMEDDGRLSRVPTKLVDDYQAAVAEGCARVGRLRRQI
jgi:beta-glucosidase